MVFNPAGAVEPFDFGVPKTVTFIARDAISGGHYVFASGADNVVSSGLNSFATSDLLCASTGSGLSFTGVALNTAGSNNPVTVALEGVFILTANGTVTPARTLLCDGNNSVATGTTAGHIIGRAVTGAASGGYCIVHIK